MIIQFLLSAVYTLILLVEVGMIFDTMNREKWGQLCYHICLILIIFLAYNRLFTCYHL